MNNYLKTSFSKNLFFLTILLLLSLFIRLKYGDYRLFDSHEYVQTAKNIESFDFFKYTEDIKNATELTKRPFVYPLIILLCGKSDLIVILFQTLLGFFNLYLMLKIFEEFGKTRFNLISLFVLFTPSIFIYTHLIMTEVVALTFILLLFIYLRKKLNFKNILIIQILITLLLFLKPSYYPFAIINFFIFIFYCFKEKKIYFSIMLPILSVICYMWFNNYRTGYTHFSSIQNINLIDYNVFLYNKKMINENRAKEWNDSIYVESKKYSTFKDKNRYLSNVGKEYIKKNIKEYTYYHIMACLKGLLDPGKYDLTTFGYEYHQSISSQFKLNKTILKSLSNSIKNTDFKWFHFAFFIILILNVLKLYLVLKSFLRNIKTLNFFKVYLIVFIAYSILIVGPVNYTRYMMPIEGILIIVAAMELENLINLRRMKIAKNKL